MLHDDYQASLPTEVFLTFARTFHQHVLLQIESIFLKPNATLTFYMFMCYFYDSGQVILANGRAKFLPVTFQGDRLRLPMADFAPAPRPSAVAVNYAGVLAHAKVSSEGPTGYRVALDFASASKPEQVAASVALPGLKARSPHSLRCAYNRGGDLLLISSDVGAVVVTAPNLAKIAPYVCDLASLL